MQHLLPKTLPDFSQASVLVVGDVMLDRYWFGESSRISPEAPVPIVKVKDTAHRPGGAGNVALNIAALGGSVTLLGVTGHDEASEILSEQLRAASVFHDFCKLDQLSTIIKLRVISRHQQLLRMDFEEKLIETHDNPLLLRFQKYLTQADVVILSDYKKGTLANPKPFIELARQANIPVLVDPKGKDFSIYQRCNIITPNFKEFETIMGPCQSEQEIIDKGRMLLSRYQIDTLILTRSEDGMTLITPDDALYLPAHAREILDVTGAGDTVISMVAAALATKTHLHEATALANLAAGLVVSKLGAATVSAPEIKAALSNKSDFATGIVTEEQLIQLVHRARLEGKKIVFTNGCFDILHPGHVLYLEGAKQLGDLLIVAVNTDDSIQKLKGMDRPINHLDHRMIMLAGLSVVDWVIPFADETPERLLQLFKPFFLVKGCDYREDQVVGAEIVHAYGGLVRIIHSNIETSSTRIINRIKNTMENKILRVGERSYDI